LQVRQQLRAARLRVSRTDRNKSSEFPLSRE